MYNARQFKNHHEFPFAGFQAKLQASKPAAYANTQTAAWSFKHQSENDLHDPATVVCFLQKSSRNYQFFGLLDTIHFRIGAWIFKQRLRVCICCCLHLKLGLETHKWKFMMILKLPSIMHTFSCHLALFSPEIVQKLSSF